MAINQYNTKNSIWAVTMMSFIYKPLNTIMSVFPIMTIVCLLHMRIPYSKILKSQAKYSIIMVKSSICKIMIKFKELFTSWSLKTILNLLKDSSSCSCSNNQVTSSQHQKRFSQGKSYLVECKIEEIYRLEMHN